MDGKIKKNKRAKKLIRELFRTQEMFSAVTGINEAITSKILRGVRIPTEKQKAAFSKYLKVPVEYLFPEKEAKSE